jgi:hypothetical protein
MTERFVFVTSHCVFIGCVNTMLKLTANILAVHRLFPLIRSFGSGAMSSPLLDGVRILDLRFGFITVALQTFAPQCRVYLISRVLAGPFATMMLADQGSDLSVFVLIRLHELDACFTFYDFQVRRLLR